MQAIHNKRPNMLQSSFHYFFLTLSRGTKNYYLWLYFQPSVATKYLTTVLSLIKRLWHSGARIKSGKKTTNQKNPKPNNQTTYNVFYHWRRRIEYFTTHSTCLPQFKISINSCALSWKAPTKISIKATIFPCEPITGYFPFDKSIFLKNKNKAKLLPIFQVNSTESDYADESCAETYVHLFSRNKSGQSISIDKR